jgi:hypothetical protein
MMNLVNASTSFSNFQLHLKQSPRLIPPIVPAKLLGDLHLAATRAKDLMSKINMDILEVQDHLLQAKKFQEHYTNTTCGHKFVYQVGNMVMLSTFNRWREYCIKGEKCTAKFFPRWDGPYKVTAVHPQLSSYTINLSPDCNDFPTYYASELKLHVQNDTLLFPSREHSRPGPMLTSEGLREHEIN